MVPVVIAMIDITPYKDLIVGNKSHVIRYSKQNKREAIRQCRRRLRGPRRINILNHNVQSQYITLATRMATGLDFSGISRFDPHADASSLSQRWNVWIKRFQRFIVAMDIKDPTAGEHFSYI